MLSLSLAGLLLHILYNVTSNGVECGLKLVLLGSVQWKCQTLHSVLPFYCFITNYPNWGRFKHQTFILSESQEFWFWLRVFHEAAAISRFDWGWRTQDVGLRAPVPPWLLTKSLPQFLTTQTWRQGSSQHRSWLSSEQRVQERVRNRWAKRKAAVSYNLTWEGAHHHFCWILCIRNESQSSAKLRGLHEDMTTTDGVTGSHPEAVFHTCFNMRQRYRHLDFMPKCQVSRCECGLFLFIQLKRN